MPAFQNPALQEFVSRMGEELVMAQVRIRRAPTGYELRHVDDATTDAKSLREIKPTDARALAQHTLEGEFRPLKSAPTLQRGWWLRAGNDAELETALAGLYPGAVADWHAAGATNPPVTNYREYTGRQSGMYRVTAKLSDAQVAQVIGTACVPSRCLKRRLWSVTGLTSDEAAQKSIIPCLEPCAILMELARKTFRNGQKDAAGAELDIANGDELG